MIDDHPLILDALAAVFANSADSIVCVATIADIDESSTSDAPDLIVLDLGLPGFNGVESVGVVRQRFPESRIVVLSANESRQIALAAIDAGAMGFIPKHFSASELCAAVDVILSGRVFVPTWVCGGDKLDNPAAASPHLTPRQLQVLALLVNGLPNKSIANTTGLSENTVKFYIAGIFRELAVSNRTQAVLAAHRLRLNLPST